MSGTFMSGLVGTSMKRTVVGSSESDAASWFSAVVTPAIMSVSPWISNVCFRSRAGARADSTSVH
jgi:hypothetical protein